MLAAISFLFTGQKTRYLLLNFFEVLLSFFKNFPKLFSKCQAWYTHKNMIFKESYFIENNLKYVKIVQKPNQILILNNGIFHQGYGSLDSISEAINIFIGTSNNTFNFCNCGEIEKIKWGIHPDYLELLKNLEEKEETTEIKETKKKLLKMFFILKKN
jgi:hypothetical protein